MLLAFEEIIPNNGTSKSFGEHFYQRLPNKTPDE